ncbi:MAG: hypothetical protein MPW15_18380 [Candidatus Manganitrophus sp.]|nr:hypothetical protein [Candidatus Manganitrophus sp.]
MLGQNYTALILAVGTDNLSGGMGSAAFVAFLMSLTERRYSATQYALLSSLMAITPKIVGAPAGVMAADIGWPMFFSVSVLGAVPGLALLWWLMRRGAIGGRVAAAPVPTD